MNIEKYFKEGTFIGSSGIKLNGYYDMIRGLIDYEFLESINEKIKSFFPINLVGIETFGLAIGLFLFAKNNKELNLLLFLKERERNNRDRLYGHIMNDRKTYLIDDVLTSGKTIINALIYLKALNIDIDAIFCVKNRSQKSLILINKKEYPILEFK